MNKKNQIQEKNSPEAYVLILPKNIKIDKPSPRTSESVDERYDEETDPYQYYNRYVLQSIAITLLFSDF